MRLVPLDGGPQERGLHVGDRPKVLGRDPGCDLLLEDVKVSRRHAALTPRPDGTLDVEDLGSSNGTWVDGRRITRATLAPGQHVRFGDTTLMLEIPVPDGATQVAGGIPSSEVTRARPLPPSAAAAAAAATGDATSPAPAAPDLGKEPPTAAAPVAPAAPDDLSGSTRRPVPPDTPAFGPPPLAAPPSPAAPGGGTPGAGAAPGAIPVPPPGAPGPGPGPAAGMPLPPVPTPEAAVASPSTVQRIVKQSTRRVTGIAIGAVVVALVAVAVAVLFATGTLGGGDDGPASAGGGPLSPEQITADATPATGAITVSADGQQVAGGTGFVIDARQGLLVTNAHVVNGHERIEVTINGRKQDASLIGSAPCDDLAIIRVANTEGLRALTLGTQSQLRPGAQVVALGFPSNAQQEDILTTTTGVVSVVRSVYRDDAIDVPVLPNVVQTDAAVNPGNSGGPLIGPNEEVVGVNTAVRTETTEGRAIQNQNYAIGIDRVRELIPELAAGRSQRYTGAGIETDPDQLAASGLPPGLILDNPRPGSPAERAGLGTSGPVVLTAINGRPITPALRSYCDATRDIRSGQTATFQVVDGAGARRDVPVQFE